MGGGGGLVLVREPLNMEIALNFRLLPLRIIIASRRPGGWAGVRVGMGRGMCDWLIEPLLSFLFLSVAIPLFNRISPASVTRV